MKGRREIASDKWVHDIFSLMYWALIFVCYNILWIFGMEILLSFLRLFVHTASYEWNELMIAAFVSVPSVFIIMLLRTVNFKQMDLFKMNKWKKGIGLFVILWFITLCMYSCDGSKSDMLMIARGLLTAILIDMVFVGLDSIRIQFKERLYIEKL